ncbi:hypothetical protein JRQ81_011967 [Phrynocephalus forsythii]|uniref:MARCKS-related protein n=1 Tax=Phrynocephalus forsythii TaxID=171643 RepID=A0A9Q1AQI0_9SAUR|nr:hypothetical protein JRQ81_011967 [Phrynocephalus forsythii]
MARDPAVGDFLHLKQKRKCIASGKQRHALAPPPPQFFSSLVGGGGESQENGHVKVNGDVSPKADGEPTPLNGNGSAEAVKEEAKGEAGNGDTIEPAPVSEGGEAKADGPAVATAKETPKKKKKFSFKKPFKLSGISFRKTKKESGDTSGVSSPTEEQGKAEVKGEESPAAATGETEQAGTTAHGEEAPEEKEKAATAPASAPEGQAEVAAKREEGSEGAAAEEGEREKPQQPPASETQAETKPEEVSKAAEVESSPIERKEE